MPDLERELLPVSFITVRDRNYSQHIGRLFPFFRRHADGRYTDRSMMKLASWAESWAGWAASPSRAERMCPTLVVVEAPFSYDPLTEVKTGGVVGMAAVAPDLDRMMIAVHREHRRRGIGTQMYNSVQQNLGKNIVLWAGRQNTAGQHFCLSLGLVATALNSSGAIRYSDEQDEDG